MFTGQSVRGLRPGRIASGEENTGASRWERAGFKIAPVREVGAEIIAK